MAKREHIYRIGACINVVQRHIARIAKGNNQLSQFRVILNRAADQRLGFQQGKSIGYRLRGSSGGKWILFSKKAATALQSQRRAFGYNYSWHGGTSVSSSEPQVSSQLRTSSPLK